MKQVINISLGEEKESTSETRRADVAPSLSSCKVLVPWTMTRERTGLPPNARDKGVRAIFRTAHFEERYASRSKADLRTLESLVRRGAEEVVKTYHDEYLNAYFIIGKSPVILDNADGTKSKGYVGIPLIWTSPFLPSVNETIVKAALGIRGSSNLSYGAPTIGAAWTYIAKTVEQGYPESSNVNDKIIRLAQSSAANIPGATTEEQQAFAHIAAAILEADAPDWKAVASGFYGHTDYLLFAGSSTDAGNSNVNMNLHTVHGTVIFV